jgi:hypothetical protein
VAVHLRHLPGGTSGRFAWGTAVTVVARVAVGACAWGASTVERGVKNMRVCAATG